MAWRGWTDHTLVLSGALVAALELAAFLVVQWAGRGHGTHCISDTTAFSPRPVRPLMEPVIYGCIAAAVVLLCALLLLSYRRRVLGLKPGRRPGVPSIVVGGLVAWCAVAYVWTLLDNGSFEGAWGLPGFLVAWTGFATVVCQYLLLVPAPVLMVLALTRRRPGWGYGFGQAALGYGPLGCVMVPVAAYLLLTGFCLPPGAGN